MGHQGMAPPTIHQPEPSNGGQAAPMPANQVTDSYPCSQCLTEPRDILIASTICPLSNPGILVTTTPQIASALAGLNPSQLNSLQQLLGQCEWQEGSIHNPYVTETLSTPPPSSSCWVNKQLRIISPSFPPCPHSP